MDFFKKLFGSDSNEINSEVDPQQSMDIDKPAAVSAAKIEVVVSKHLLLKQRKVEHYI